MNDTNIQVFGWDYMIKWLITPGYVLPIVPVKVVRIKHYKKLSNRKA